MNHDKTDEYLPWHFCIKIFHARYFYNNNAIKYSDSNKSWKSFITLCWEIPMVL